MNDAPDEDDDRLFFLIIDDSPGRYEEFTRLLDEGKPRHRRVITHDPRLAEQLVAYADVILLDHDMPGPDGRERAAWIAGLVKPVPVIVTSTTGLVGARESMVATLGTACVPALLCPADHHNCEIEWLNWALGAVAGARAGR